MIADALLSLEPCVGAQPQHVVVDKARAAERPGKHGLLLGRRAAAETIGALDLHSHIPAAMCGTYERVALALYLPGLKAKVSREF